MKVNAFAVLTAAQFKALRAASGWLALPDEQVEKALKGSLYTLIASRGEEVVGMGRLVGDGAIIMYLQDIVVLPSCRHVGIGREIVTRICAVATQMAGADTTHSIALFSAKNREPFYQHLGFVACPSQESGAGMKLKVNSQNPVEYYPGKQHMFYETY